jgi:NAD(P)-dependent dehydrogenase (short-subunit alcohol dehydrogenase family)
VAELGLRGVTIDALVNGAALRHPGSFVHADETELLGVLHVNLAALAHLTRLVLPGMLARRWGRIVNFSSADALRLGSRRAMSRAGEAFVLSFSLALADELRDSGVRAIAVCLPPALPAPSSGPRPWRRGRPLRFGPISPRSPPGGTSRSSAAGLSPFAACDGRPEPSGPVYYPLPSWRGSTGCPERAGCPNCTSQLEGASA